MATTGRQRVIKAAERIHAYQAATGRVHYTEDSRRLTIVREKLKPPFHSLLFEDCSSFADGCYWIAGAHDPNETHFDPGATIYTGSLCRHGTAVARPRPGDLVFYGRGAPWLHVAIYAGNGYVWSHGHEGGPYYAPMRYRSDVGEYRRYLP